MEEVNANSEKLAVLMARESTILKEFLASGIKIMSNLNERNWNNLQIQLTLSRKLSLSIEEIEKERDHTFECLKKSLNSVDSENFFQVVFLLKSPIREELIDHFRDLKLALLHAQGVSWEIESYVSSAGGTIKELLNRVYPLRKGNIYSKKGAIRETGSHPMVLNKEL